MNSFEGLDRWAPRVVADPFCPRGTAYVMSVDRMHGTITAAVKKIAAGGSPDRVFLNTKDYEALQRELDRGFDQLRESMSRTLYGNGDIVHFETGMVITASASGPARIPTTVAIAATVTLAGLGWIIRRRNALAGEAEQDSESWAAEVVAWVMALVRGLLGMNDVRPS